MTMIMPNKDKDSFGTISPKSEVDGASPLHIQKEETNESRQKTASNAKIS